MLEITKGYNSYLYNWYGWLRGYIQSWMPHRADFHEIQPNIFVGDLGTAYNKEELKQAGITHIVNSVIGVPAAFPDEFIYLNVGLRDQPYEDISLHFAETNSFIDSALKNGGKVLIHCICGISRSATIAAAYLISKKGISPETAIEVIKHERSVINPNQGFRKQLEEFHKNNMSKSCMF